MAANSVSSLAAACIQLYSGMGSTRLVEQFVITYTSYISLCLLACLSAGAALLKRRRGDADAKNAASAALSLHIPYVPSFEHLLFLAPLFLAISNLFLLVVRVYDIRARPFPYTSQQQFELASLSSQMFTTFLVLIPIGTLFSSLARMVFMFRLVLLCQKIGITHNFAPANLFFSTAFCRPLHIRCHEGECCAPHAESAAATFLHPPSFCQTHLRLHDASPF
jgi:uncharacterized membrane protein YhaH (DUF805 family)